MIKYLNMYPIVFLTFQYNLTCYILIANMVLTLIKRITGLSGKIPLSR